MLVFSSVTVAFHLLHFCLLVGKSLQCRSVRTMKVLLTGILFFLSLLQVSHFLFQCCRDKQTGQCQTCNIIQTVVKIFMFLNQATPLTLLLLGFAGYVFLRQGTIFNLVCTCSSTCLLFSYLVFRMAVDCRTGVLACFPSVSRMVVVVCFQ